MAKAHFPRVTFTIHGKEYRRAGYFGCQLESMEWRRVPAGAERVLDLWDGEAPLHFRVFSTARQGIRYRTTWALPSHGPLDEHSRRIDALTERLRRLV